MSDDHADSVGKTLAARLAHIADALEKGEPMKSTTVVRVAGDEAAQRIIARLHVEVARLQAQVEELRMTPQQLKAIDVAIQSMSGVEDMDSTWPAREAMALETLRGLRDRHAKGGAA